MATRFRHARATRRGRPARSLCHAAGARALRRQRSAALCPLPLPADRRQPHDEGGRRTAGPLAGLRGGAVPGHALSSSTTRRTSRRKCTGAMWKPAPSCHSAAASARNARNPTSRARPGSMSRPGRPGNGCATIIRRLLAAGWRWRRRRGRCAVGLARAARRAEQPASGPGAGRPLSGPAPRPAAMPHPFSPGRARPPAAAAAASWPRPARAGAGRVRSQPCR